MSNHVPDLDCRRLSKEEAVQRVRSEPGDDDLAGPLVELIEADEVTVWLQPDGELRFQYKARIVARNFVGGTRNHEDAEA